MFRFGKRKKSEQQPKQQRKKLSDVKAGDFITIEWWRAEDKIVNIIVLNNDPETKKILIEINWKAPEPYERIVLDYSDVALKNFHLLNQIKLKPVNHNTKEDKETESEKIQRQIEDAIKKDDFEEVIRLQKQLKQLTDKK